MIFFQFAKDFVHDGFAEEDGFGVHLETGAVFVDDGQFAVVEVQYIAVLSEEQGFLLLQVGGIYAGYSLFAGHSLKLYVAVLYHAFPVCLDDEGHGR